MNLRIISIVSAVALLSGTMGFLIGVHSRHADLTPLRRDVIQMRMACNIGKKRGQRPNDFSNLLKQLQVSKQLYSSDLSPIQKNELDAFVLITTTFAIQYYGNIGFSQQDWENMISQMQHYGDESIASLSKN